MENDINTRDKGNESVENTDSLIDLENGLYLENDEMVESETEPRQK